ncbi:restriction endonuclease [Candidatus Albibeggiatoa sp. nov. NOAA]|uniref:restriction endonuclease n=1 Tax=Candidatus Albibeggiatoa sp. nov. NOAA TaxID=3162724 RepID=UPI0032F4CBA5|nr:restriction endonuclease [Thiotrichaceae bacterium]
MSWIESIANKTKQTSEITEDSKNAEEVNINMWDNIGKSLTDTWGSVEKSASETWSNIEKSVSNTGHETINAIQTWIINLIVKAIQSCSTEQDRLEIIAWLALVREILNNPELSTRQKATQIYDLLDSRKAVGVIFRSVGQSVENYKNADLPLAVKVAIPTTLAAATVVGGQGVGIAAFGTAIGLPVLLLIFIGAAGITAIIETFFSQSESKDYISLVMAIIATDVLLRETKKALKEAMTSEPEEPKPFKMPSEEQDLRDALLNMNPYDFERHVMSFFQKYGLAWVTKKSNDAGIDGFARHSNGLIIVQCKRNAPTNPVGRPMIQQFKGVLEENEETWKGYIVTTSYFTREAKENALKNDKIVLIDMDILIQWHLEKFLIEENI